jgi:hypothetical protein
MMRIFSSLKTKATLKKRLNNTQDKNVFAKDNKTLLLSNAMNAQSKVEETPIHLLNRSHNLLHILPIHKDRNGRKEGKTLLQSKYQLRFHLAHGHMFLFRGLVL